MMTSLAKMRLYYDSGNTRACSFRKSQLVLLKNAILQHEKELQDALFADLKKNPEESWVTETGFILAEINHTLKHLERWMKPKKVPTNLLNFPSKSYILHEPLGVVLIIGPWNYPFQLLLAPLIGAIAAGNCSVLKPSEFAPATAVVMKKILSVFPDDYILFTEGDGAMVVPQLMNNFRFDHVFFTGGTQVGKIIYEMAAKQLVPVTLELGGKSPCVVESDANIKVTAKRIAVAKFSNAGQMCVAPDYLLVHETIKNELVEALKKTIVSFFSEDPKGSYNYGKIISEKQFRRLVSLLQEGRVVMGGRNDISSLYLEPTLIEDVPFDSAIMKEEIFGPLLPIYSFRNFEEARSIINRHPDPLAFYVYTESSENVKRWLEGVSFGGGCVNNTSFHLLNFNLPFGGRGNSGIGSYHGKYSFYTFSHAKSIMKTPTWFDPALKYPPFRGKLNLLKKFIR